MSNRYQIKAFQSQFPALFATRRDGDREVYVHGAFGVLSEVRVARVTPELMAHAPHCEQHPYSWNAERVLLFTHNWTLLGSVAQSESGQIGHTRFDARGESVGEAISRLGCARDVAFIASIVEDDPHEGERTTEVVVHKTPKGWSIPEWIAREERRARNQLAGDLLEIDRVV